MNFDEAQTQPAHDTAPSQIANHGPALAAEHDAGSVDPATPAEDDFDSTPRSEAPSVPDTVNEALQRLHVHGSEPSYFSPQPRRVYTSQIARSNPSTEPSPTTTAALDGPHLRSVEPITELSSGLAEHVDRPVYQRDLSSASTASASTVRPTSVEPFHTFLYSRQRDGPVYPNQSYAALQSQQYPNSHGPPILRTRSSHPTHGHSVSNISNFSHANEHHHNIMESGSRTVGNSPASSPGLFSPATPPLRHTQQSEDNLYSGPWLHHTHRQPPKETHVADVDVDPVSGRKLVNHYEVIGELGRGVHGKVKLGRNLEDGATVAIKIVDRYSKRRRLGKNTSHEDKIKREIAILKKARHANIVSLLEVIDDPSKKKVYIILEHVKNGEVKWRTEGAKEVCMVEWRRYQRESEGIFDNESAALEDEKIIRLAHQKLERQQRRRAKALRQRRQLPDDLESWSFELGGDSEEDFSENERSSRALEDRPESRLHYAEHHGSTSNQGTHMETAIRSSTPTASTKGEDPTLSTGLEGTMYGAYDTETFRGRTPSLAGSSSSHFTDGEEEVPEHFRYVPLMTIQAAREAFRDTVLGLEYLHYQGVIHRDIKPANLLVTAEHRIKISDFGVSYLGRPAADDSNGDQSESDMHDADEAIELAKTVGTPAFYAPELCHTDPDVDAIRIGPQIDIWALGVTLYCLIYGRVPFHDPNQFRLMKVITDAEPYIPKYRLKPVAENSNSRPSSHGRLYHPMTTSRRAPHDLEYEEVSEDLQDLLRRLFVKDPRYRISVQDIKRHPWLTQGIEDLTAWVERTDPDKSSHGRKIEISKADIDDAVVPFTTFLDRVRFGVRKIGDMARSLTRQASRKRGLSSASGQDPHTVGSAHSSSSTISQDGRRPSLGPGMTIYEALSRSREPEHPLSQSQTASPEASDRQRYFESPNARNASPAHNTEAHERPSSLALAGRPPTLGRANTTASTTGSIRTIRPSEPSSRGRPPSPNIPPGLPGTPTVLDTPGGSNLSGIFGGLPRHVVRNRTSDERMLMPPREHARAKSIDRLVGTDSDAHSGPSLAISTAVASGHVDQPDLLKELSPTVACGPSPNFSDSRSPGSMDRGCSRQSSVSSISSRLQRSWAARSHELEAGSTLAMSTVAHAPLARDTSDERFSRAKDEFVRRRVIEENLGRERPHSATFQRPPSSLSQTACPPSPDDETFYQRQKVEDFLNQQHASSHNTSPISYPIIHPPQTRTVNSSSSEDHFTFMSQSTSNPSIPSVASANSSMAPDECVSMNSFSRGAGAASADSLYINQFDAPTDDPAGYDGDHAVETEDDDEDSDDDFLVMGKKKKPAPRSESISNAELARSRLRKEVSVRRRSARSGSNGTVKKIPPPGDSGDENSPETQ
ncbi:kinase-like protein [Trematosphaeria pertusa]|uniref:non-specific serine/threonine protein kinase n=1 Tax=Trematosphaeria pertusa TaxID=390896 RepID=A0A6A6J154_9PLEO|nr:kinase-like protein [Trematosphaeria pertusa]KAF2256268.1 kinase-like protein [Trematosphaeria pertusa]